jgi:mannosyltransferase OCH1-like enzyme
MPKGTVVKDANKIFPLNERRKFIHNSQAADYCRVLLILQEGGWYVDLDTICLRPFDFQEPYVFVSEDTSRFNRGQKDVSAPLTPCLETVTRYISNSTFKAPANSPYLEYIADKIRNLDMLHPKSWTTAGPELFSEAVPKFALQRYVKPPIVFDAANPDELYHFIAGGVRYNISEKSYAMHLRTSWWKENQLSRGQHPSSLFEQLKRKHGVE